MVSVLWLLIYGEGEEGLWFSMNVNHQPGANGGSPPADFGAENPKWSGVCVGGGGKKYKNARREHF